jgi:hypothetical protein
MSKQPDSVTTGSKRLSVTVSTEMDLAIRTLACRKGISKTEALRRLLLMGDMMAKADAAGEEILFVGKHETLRVRPI